MVESRFKKAVENNLSFDEFLEIIDNDELSGLLRNSDVERRFYAPRDHSDTAKAIYRLVSLGIVDTYTIDYANNLYQLKICKRTDGYFFDKLYDIFKKYSSEVAAKTQIEKIKQDRRFLFS